MSDASPVDGADSTPAAHEAAFSCQRPARYPNDTKAYVEGTLLLVCGVIGGHREKSHARHLIAIRTALIDAGMEHQPVARSSYLRAVYSMREVMSHRRREEANNEGPFKDLDDRRAQDIWARARVAAGIKHRDCVIHCLRHTWRVGSWRAAST